MDTCNRCKWFRRQDNSGGFCMIAPPPGALIAGPDGRPQIMPVRAPVAADDYCKSFEVGIARPTLGTVHKGRES